MEKDTESLFFNGKDRNLCNTLLFAIPAISISICSLTLTVLLSLTYVNISDGMDNITIHLDIEYI